MKVIKRNGQPQDVDLNKILTRISYLAKGLLPGNQSIGPPLEFLDPVDIAKSVCSQLVDGISTSRLDEFAAEICAFKCADHPDYGHLASRLVISNHHKNNNLTFSEMMTQLYTYTDFKGQHVPLIDLDFYMIVLQHKEQLDQAIDDLQDYSILDYFGFKTLYRSYLLKTNKYQEKYQHLLMRVALAIYLPEAQQGNLQPALECYKVFSQGLMTHATPTLFNAGTPRPQLSSCYLAGIHDSIKGMYAGLDNLSQLSKWAGGIGIWIHSIRSKGALIRGTNGQSSGIIPYLKVLNDFACHVNQGGKRKGSVAVYISPWHADIRDFLNLKKNHGSEALRARDLFYALWVSDLFMERVSQALTSKTKTKVKWSLFCPDKCPDLIDAYGDDFKQRYLQHEYERHYIQQVDILEIWQAILDSQKETGVPYVLFKDAVNQMNNQSHIGTIKSSNLCAEIQLYSDHKETAVCNLASINLKAMVVNGQFDFQKLGRTVCQAVSNLNRVIDINWYPIKEARRSNFRHRPMGIGVQGLADTFFLLRMPYDSPQARQLNKDIFEAIYYHALKQSHQLAVDMTKKLTDIPPSDLQLIKDLSAECDYLSILKESLWPSELKDRQDLGSSYEHIKYQRTIQQLEQQYQQLLKLLKKYQLPTHGWQQWQYLDLDPDNRKFLGAYPTFKGSQLSKGVFHFDMYHQRQGTSHKASGRWDWQQLRQDIQAHGVRNSMLVALMPTASTAQILGNIEAFEPQTSNLYARRVLSGTFMVVNKYLQADLLKLGLWSVNLKERIMLNNGSIQNLPEIPQELKELYKTAWEISKKSMIEMATDRGQYVDHSQSFNMFISDPTDNILTSVLLYGWKLGLKTGIYYLRRQTLVNPQQFSIDLTKHLTVTAIAESTESTGPSCTMCSG